MIHLEQLDSPGSRTVLRDGQHDAGALAAMRADCSQGLAVLRDRLSSYRLSGLPWFVQLPPADRSLLESYPIVLTAREPSPPAVAQPVDLALAGSRMFLSGLTEQSRFVLLGEPYLEDDTPSTFPLGHTALYYARTASGKTGVAGMVYNYCSDGTVELAARLQPLPEDAVRDDFVGVWERLGLAAIAPLPDPAYGLVITAEQVDGTQLQALSDYLVRAN